MADAERTRQLYDRRAGDYDAGTRSRTLQAMRAALFARASGDVLELGVGTGATFAHYPARLHSLTGLDVSGAMLRRARLRARDLPFPVTLLERDFQTLPFPAASFDTVASSLSLCGIPDPARLFQEVRRVLRPGGQLLALEHVRPAGSVLGPVTDLLDPLFEWRVGCHLNRPTPQLLRGAGFTLEQLDRRALGLLVALRATPP